MLPNIPTCWYLTVVSINHVLPHPYIISCAWPSLLTVLCIVIFIWFIVFVISNFSIFFFNISDSLVNLFKRSPLFTPPVVFSSISLQFPLCGHLCSPWLVPTYLLMLPLWETLLFCLYQWTFGIGTWHFRSFSVLSSVVELWEDPAASVLFYLTSLWLPGAFYTFLSLVFSFYRGLLIEQPASGVLTPSSAQGGVVESLQL